MTYWTLVMLAIFYFFIRIQLVIHVFDTLQFFWRLKKHHVTQGEQNKIAMKRWGGGRMRSAKLKKESWLMDLDLWHVFWKYLKNMLISFGYNTSRKKKPKLDKERRKKLLHQSLKSGKESFRLMLKVLQKMKCKMEAKACSLISWSTLR